MELAALERWPGIAGQTAVVTGASRGIGRAIAEALVRQGANVIGTATTASGAEGITSRLGEIGERSVGRMLDVTDGAAIDAFWEEVTAEFSAPTILVNNAGITRDNLLMRMKDDEWDQVLATNLTALHRVCKAALRGMMKARHGRIINVSSVVGLTGNPGQANYAAAKAGMIGFSNHRARVHRHRDDEGIEREADRGAPSTDPRRPPRRARGRRSGGGLPGLRRGSLCHG
jgi:3-oxoacyl-[acyl-carrier protein] reductase